MTRVLIVEDSPTVRLMLEYVFNSAPGIEVVGSAADGAEALRMCLALRPDVITMDLHMPGMDGVAATAEIMRQCPTPIVVVSGSQVAGEVDASFRAMEAGALMAVQRPAPVGSERHAADAAALIRTVKSMAEVKVVRRWASRLATVEERPLKKGTPGKPKLVLVGASTGGPAVLREILAELRQDFPLPIVIVQHMAPGFGPGFASWLGSSSKFDVRLAHHGETLERGRAYIVPDGVQPRITRDLRLELSGARVAEHGMCPSVSHLFRCVHQDLAPSVVAVLLTGMGKDGATELRALKERGALTIVQDRASSAVYGMPGEAVRQDAAKFVLAPTEIGRMLDALGSGTGWSMPLVGDGNKE